MNTDKIDKINILKEIEATEQKKKIEQKLLLEYLLDPFMTVDEATKLSELSISPTPSRNNQRVSPSTRLVVGE